MILIAFATGFAVQRAAKKGYGNGSYAALTACIFGAVALCLEKNEWIGAATVTGFVPLFVSLLPLLNAIFDYISYALTFTLLRLGLIHPRRAILYGALDLLAAGFLFALSGAAMILALTAANVLAGVELYPIRALLDGIRENPGDYWWVYLMPFSTIVPTLLHFGVALFSLGAWLTPGLRRYIHANIGATDAAPAIGIPLVIGGYWTACLTLPTLALWGLWHAATQVFFPYPFAWYLGWMQRVSDWAFAWLVPLA